MKIVKSFKQWKENGTINKHYSVEVEVQDSNGLSLAIFRVPEQLKTLGVWIQGSDIVNKEILEELKVEYKVIDDKVIPIGLVDFLGYSFPERCLPIVFDTIQEQTQFDEILSQLEDAIKYQHNLQIFRSKCMNNTKEETEI